MAHIVNSDISGLPKDANVSCARRWSLHAAMVINVLQKTSDLSRINKKRFQRQRLKVSLGFFLAFHQSSSLSLVDHLSVLFR